ncbi:MAG: hypothetical protein JO166_04930 [Deltaproteobacteria bacterium]|nr:hypothetical protein [Deltaproteobacteria bacterium]
MAESSASVASSANSLGIFPDSDQGHSSHQDQTGTRSKASITDSQDEEEPTKFPHHLDTGLERFPTENKNKLSDQARLLTAFTPTASA